MMNSQASSGLPPNGDIEPWWKLWEKNQEWQDSLAKRAAHKALDIPDDDMQINSNTETKNGIGSLGAIGIAMAAALPLPLVLLSGGMVEKPAEVIEKIVETPGETIEKIIKPEVTVEVDVIPPPTL